MGKYLRSRKVNSIVVDFLLISVDVESSDEETDSEEDEEESKPRIGLPKMPGDSEVSSGNGSSSFSV